MFFGIKCNTLRLIRTLPIIWIKFVNEVPHCWIPKTEYCEKLKLRAQPPNETDVEGMKEWDFAECEILFGKPFFRVNDCEMALSSLDCDPSWLLYAFATEPSEDFKTFTKEGKTIVPAESTPAWPTEAITETPNEAISVTPTEATVTAPFSLHSISITPTETLADPTEAITETQTEAIGVSPTEATVSAPFPLHSIFITPTETLADPTEAITETPTEAIGVTPTEATVTAPFSLHSISITPTETLADPTEAITKTSTEAIGMSPTEATVSAPFPLHSISITPTETLADPTETPTEAIGVTPTEATVAASFPLYSISITPTETLADPTETPTEPTVAAPTKMLVQPTKPVSATLAKRQCDLSDLETHEENKRLCKLYNFPRPISPQALKKIAWTFVHTVEDELEPGYSFKTLQELASIKRSFNDPFCRPGPFLKDKFCHWYLADSIVQEVYLKSVESPFYVVRWRGYEDEYNTVEPQAYLEDTAIYLLYTEPDLCTACGMSGSVLRSGKKLQNEPVRRIDEPMNVEPTQYELAMGKLMAELSIEEEAGRFCPKVGFYSRKNVTSALKTQHTFLFEKFLPIVNELGSAVHVDKHYVGNFCGNLSQAAEFKKVAAWEMTHQKTIKDNIYLGLAASGKGMLSEDTPRFVSFFAPKKFGTSEKKDKKQLKFHMCVFTVRSHGNTKDAIYFDPSPFNRNTSSTIDSIRAPKFQSFTKNFGVVSENNDCLLQCMEYIIALATGKRTFDPDPSKPARKLDIYMQEREEKRRKI